MEKRGLTEAEVLKRRQQYGLNEIKEISRLNAFKIFLRQIKSNFIVYLLFGAMLLSFFVGKAVTAYVILFVIVMVIGVGFVQEYKADKAIKTLKKMIVPISIAIRDGKEKDLPSSELVPDDIIVLRSGEKVPADCIIIEAKELLVDEAVLTGESKEVRKEPAADKMLVERSTKTDLKINVEKNSLPNHQKNSERNFLFMGSFIISGRCVAKVIRTGMDTRFGKIAALISTAEKELPLQKKVNKIAKYMVIVALVVSVLTGLLMLFHSQDFSYSFLASVLVLIIALSVSAFPEGLPVVLIVSLAFGARHMAKQNAIVNRMSIIQTLGETTVICSDKTGTITKGEMTVRQIFTDEKIIEVEGAGYEAKGRFLFGEQELKPLSRTNFNSNLNHNSNSTNSVLFSLLKAAVLCNDSRIERTGENHLYRGVGTPTEVALLILGAKAGIFKDDLKFTRREEIPFTSERKMMSVLCAEEKKVSVFVKGAPEIVLDKCRFIQKQKGIFPLNGLERQKIKKAIQAMTAKTFRTLALARKEKINGILEENLIFLGLVGMEDPPREGVKEAIAHCQQAGIEVKMITGDNKETAAAIAQEVHLAGKVMDGQELDAIPDAKLLKIIKQFTIFARVRPEHKLRIVRALKSCGEIVTMTGDGVNDAPALKEAHIGVAMGRSGTDVSREVADLTLKDDNFTTIVTAIEEGRTIFRNIKKFVTYQLSCNLTELLVLFLGVLFAPLLGWQIPLLLAIQILFVNLVTDNLPAITLGLNPPSNDVMLEKPRKGAELLTKEMLTLLFFTGILIAFFVMSVFYISFNVFQEDGKIARTVALVSLILLEIASAFNFRSFRKGVLNRSPLANIYLFYASLISIGATIAIIHTPLNKIFETASLSLSGWILALAPAVALIIIFDILKFINNKIRLFNHY